MLIKVVRNIMEQSEADAQSVADWLHKRKAVMVNLMSSPGAGKTTLLLNLVPLLEECFSIAILEGDIATTTDAEKLAGLGKPIVQINTGGACHLEPHLVLAALNKLADQPFNVVLTENVGNLVCPAAFRIGESLRVVLGSVPEGEDKPRKYPQMFREADAVVVNKWDLAEPFGFNEAEYFGDLARLNPKAAVFLTSARTGEGLPALAEWLTERLGTLLAEEGQSGDAAS
jgi:hydrogenase nickel incorporation protein HypB